MIMAFHKTDSCSSCNRAALMDHAPTCFLVRLDNAREAGAELTACRAELADLTAAHGHASNAFALLAGLPSLRAMVAELTACLELAECLVDGAFDGEVDLVGLAENQLDDIEKAICAGTVAA